MALLEVNRRRGPGDGVNHWVFDGAAGRICARDADGHLVMALSAGPFFGPRLAAAFSCAPAGSLELSGGLRRSSPVPPVAASA